MLNKLLIDISIYFCKFFGREFSACLCCQQARRDTTVELCDLEINAATSKVSRITSLNEMIDLMAFWTRAA
jgi:hypothetical protein